MRVFELLILSIGLSLDVFAVMIYFGSVFFGLRKEMVIKMCASFWIWHMFSLLLGHWIANIDFIENAIHRYSHLNKLIAALIFLALGLYMWQKTTKNDAILERRMDHLPIKKLLSFLFITAIDSFWVGLSLGFLQIELGIISIFIIINTILFVLLGLWIGYHYGAARIKTLYYSASGLFFLISGITFIDFIKNLGGRIV